MRSPLCWVGGKFFMVKNHLPLFPEHKNYVEPFCGSAQMLFAKPPSKQEVLNDIDNDIVNFFRVLRDDDKRAELIKLLTYTPHSRTEFNDIADKYMSDRFTELSDVQRAYVFYYLNINGFSSMMTHHSYGRSNVKCRASTYFNHIDEFNNIAERMRTVIIECLDFRDIFKKYDHEISFFYVDPPYIGARENAYRHSFTIDDHKDLLKIIKNVRGKVMICGYDNQLYNDELDGWIKIGFNKAMCMDNNNNKRRHVQEFVWLNYDPPNKQS